MRDTHYQHEGTLHTGTQLSSDYDGNTSNKAVR